MSKKELFFLGFLALIAGILGTLWVVIEGPNTEVVDRSPDKEVETINLYYYNPQKDTDSLGNIMCSQQGLVSVERKVEEKNITRAIKILLAGDLGNSEKEQGLTTEFPLLGFELLGADLIDGTLTLEFADPENMTIGGACRTGILWHQIEATAKQFKGVTEVRFSPETLFQP